MICANCGYERSAHPTIDGRRLCVQASGVFLAKTERYDLSITYSDEDSVPQNETHTVLRDDIQRLGHTVRRILDGGGTSVQITVSAAVYADGQGKKRG